MKDLWIWYKQLPWELMDEGLGSGNDLLNSGSR